MSEFHAVLPKSIVFCRSISNEMLERLKQLLGGSSETTYGYSCSDCETSFSLPETTPIECVDCGSSEFVVPDRNLLINHHRCNGCSAEFAFPDGVELVCPDCDSVSISTIQ